MRPRFNRLVHDPVEETSCVSAKNLTDGHPSPQFGRMTQQPATAGFLSLEQQPTSQGIPPELRE